MPGTIDTRTAIVIDRPRLRTMYKGRLVTRL